MPGAAAARPSRCRPEAGRSTPSQPARLPESIQDHTFHTDARTHTRSDTDSSLRALSWSCDAEWSTAAVPRAAAASPSRCRPEVRPARLPQSIQLAPMLTTGSAVIATLMVQADKEQREQSRMDGGSRAWLRLKLQSGSPLRSSAAAARCPGQPARLPQSVPYSRHETLQQVSADTIWHDTVA